MNRFLKVSEEVKSAVEEGRAVVALESTIISHGMPYPQNVETALRAEGIVRECGAVPATVAVLDGKLVVGCSGEEIERIGKAGHAVTKVSRRDLPFVLASKSLGATTVAGTMVACELAGIKVFATGGIGGVHRGAQQTFDISADLEELKQTPVLVVCAGAKSILDLKLTLECLETRGVAVVGHKTDELPAFFTRKSGLKVDFRLDSPKDIANAFLAQRSLGLNGGMLVTNPIPEQYAMDSELISKIIDDAVKECEQLGVKGKEITPFLLEKVQNLTGGDSLKANIELVFNNVRLACEIAKNI